MRLNGNRPHSRRTVRALALLVSIIFVIRCKPSLAEPSETSPLQGYFVSFGIGGPSPPRGFIPVAEFSAGQPVYGGFHIIESVLSTFASPTEVNGTVTRDIDVWASCGIQWTKMRLEATRRFDTNSVSLGIGLGALFRSETEYRADGKVTSSTVSPTIFIDAGWFPVQQRDYALGVKFSTRVSHYAEENHLDTSLLFVVRLQISK